MTGAQGTARPTGATAPKGDKVAEAYQDLLQEIVEKKKKAVEIRKLPKKRKKGPIIKAVLAVVLPLIAAAMWIWNPFAAGAPTTPRPPDEAGAWREALVQAALQIRDWHDSAGGLPVDLEAADVRLQGVTYEVTGPDEFQLKTFTSDGVVMVWMDHDRLGVGPKPAPVDSASALPPPSGTP